MPVAPPPPSRVLAALCRGVTCTERAHGVRWHGASLGRCGPRGTGTAQRRTDEPHLVGAGSLGFSSGPRPSKLVGGRIGYVNRPPWAVHSQKGDTRNEHPERLWGSPSCVTFQDTTDTLPSGLLACHRAGGGVTPH